MFCCRHHAVNSAQPPQGQQGHAGSHEVNSPFLFSVLFPFPARIGGQSHLSHCQLKRACKLQPLLVQFLHPLGTDLGRIRNLLDLVVVQAEQPKRSEGTRQINRRPPRRKRRHGADQTTNDSRAQRHRRKKKKKKTEHTGHCSFVAILATPRRSLVAARVDCSLSPQNATLKKEKARDSCSCRRPPPS